MDEPDLKNDTLSRLSKLVGKTGPLPVREHGEVRFTVLSVEPPTEIGADIERAINWSKFTVRFDEGVYLDGKNTIVVYGLHISRFFGGY
jgi:hypothetical protein